MYHVGMTLFEPPVSPLAREMLKLLLLPGIGPIRAVNLIEAFGGDVDRLLGASHAAWSSVPGVGEVTARRALAAVRGVDTLVEEELELLDRHGVGLVAHGEAGYPPLLAELPGSPRLLYVRGSLDPEGVDRYPVAIVGSRRCTTYGIEQAERFAGVLGRSGLTVVSGGARGIDTAAHRGAIRSGGRTVSVQGCGLAHCYPPENGALYERIVGEGLGAVVSELPMRTDPRGELFPARNRIISGLSLGVIVIEAGAKSGALITARLAAEEHGREVMVLPGRVDSTASAGSLGLLKSGGGAMVTEPGDVLDLLETPARFAHEGLHGVRYQDPGREMDVEAGADGVSSVILEALSAGPSTLDELAGRAGLSVDRVRVTLTLLELSGRVKRSGSRFDRSCGDPR